MNSRLALSRIVSSAIALNLLCVGLALAHTVEKVGADLDRPYERSAHALEQCGGADRTADVKASVASAPPTLHSRMSDEWTRVDLSPSRLQSGGTNAKSPLSTKLAMDAAAKTCNAASGACRVSGTTQIFTDQAAFRAALAPGYVANKFAEVVTGASGILNYVDGNIKYLVFTENLPESGLHNGPGFISTDNENDGIRVDFSSNGAPVTAIGGNFWSVDFSSRPISGTIELLLDDGTQETIQSTGRNDFRGFITQSPISRLAIDAPDISFPPAGASPDRWPAIDNLVIGNAR